MELTEREKNFIKHYNGLYKSYLGLFIFISFLATIQLYIMFNKYIPLYTKTFQNYPEIQDFVGTGLTRCVGVSFIWIAILIGVLVGNFYSYKITKQIIMKLYQNK